MKIPFVIETQLNKILKPNIITIVETRIDGKLQRRFYGKSLVANFLQIYYSQLAQSSANFGASGAPYGNNSQSVRTTGALANTGTFIARADAGVGIVTNGIIVGSNNTAVTAQDFILNTAIAQGVGAGQLQYGAQLSPAGCNITGLNTVMTLRRSMSNGSGGNVTVREVGLYVLNNSLSHMIYRDVVSPDDVIGNGQTYTVDLIWTITS